VHDYLNLEPRVSSLPLANVDGYEQFYSHLEELKNFPILPSLSAYYHPPRNASSQNILLRPSPPTLVVAAPSPFVIPNVPSSRVILNPINHPISSDTACSPWHLKPPRWLHFEFKRREREEIRTSRKTRAMNRGIQARLAGYRRLPAPSLGITASVEMWVLRSRYQLEERRTLACQVLLNLISARINGSTTQVDSRGSWCTGGSWKRRTRPSCSIHGEKS
jgi:hypothetical protein